MTLLGLDVHELRAQGQEPELMVAFGEGCVQCRSTGLLGRTGVFEVLEVDDKIRKLVVAQGERQGDHQAGAPRRPAHAPRGGHQEAREGA